MPRGGFGGGGFHGGGGFRGGGFRGISHSFRSSSSHNSFSSRPFGRTGARRTTSSSSRSRSGPYRHYHSYNRYYRPWYRRSWWMWWGGSYYRPWYRSPMSFCGSFVIIIVVLLIILPTMLTTMSYPFSSEGTSGTVNYRDTETLNFNEYWYEYESMGIGGSITYTVSSSNAPISFIITDKDINDFPKGVNSGNDAASFVLEENEYKYFQYFLNPGSTLDFSFNSSANIEFLIADGTNVGNWANYESASYLYYQSSIQNDSSTVQITTNDGAQDFYLLWYNPTNVSISVDAQVTYTQVGAWDFSSALVNNINTDYVPEQTVTVPNSGTWYFYVFMDPMNTPEESTDITFDVTFTPNVDGVSQWKDQRGTLITIGVIVALLIVIAVVARKKQRKDHLNANKASTSQAASNSATQLNNAIYGKSKQGASRYQKAVNISTSQKPMQTQPKPSSSTISTTIPSAKYGKCIFCGAPLTKDAIFCSSCGRKQEGRQYGVGPKISTPKYSKICSLCGSTILPGVDYCPNCGTKVEK
ncbi:MAG: zinc ribbon domain-containing protein [Promethearchaeota archaeon]